MYNLNLDYSDRTNHQHNIILKATFLFVGAGPILSWGSTLQVVVAYREAEICKLQWFIFLTPGGIGEVLLFDLVNNQHNS